MKKIVLSSLLVATSIFAETNLNSILKNVSIPNVDKTIESARVLQKDMNAQNFTQLIKDWKKVEALYFAGDINEDYIDTPRYIDVYHNLKENLHKQMQRAINSNDKPRVALFKNSFRTVNALEYVLFNDDKITDREKEIATEIVNSIVSNLEDIKEVYKDYLASPIKSEKWENSLLINTLIASSFRLREWRVGEPAGYAAKFKNDKSNERAEYFLSQNSFNAINAILNAHDEVLGDKNYMNFATMAKKAGAAEEVKISQEAIALSLDILSKLPKDDFSNAKPLFDSTRKLHNAYFLSLVEQLAVTAKILDADGD